MSFGRELLQKKLAETPELPGVYQMFDEHGKILYIGKAKNLRKRLSNYTRPDLPLRTARMVFLIRELEYIITRNAAEALLLEASLIKKMQPRFNVLLKDDKSFPYIKIDLENEFPKIIKYRGKVTNSSLLYGPFSSSNDVDTAISELQKIFLLRTCSDYYFATRKRPCLLYQIKKCSAPCTGKIDKENYAALVNQAKNFLSGKVSIVQAQLSKQMQHYSDALEFERAAELRDRIKALSIIQGRSSNLNSNIKDADVIVALQQNGQYCVQIVFYRAGQYYGYKSYFPQNTEGVSYEEVLGNFLGLFYQSHIPAETIILEKSIEDIDVIVSALNLLHHIDVKIIVNDERKYTDVLNNALQNAKVALDNKLKFFLQNKETLEELQKLFELDNLPTRIEIYDNSHIMGQYGVGVMVVSTQDGFAKDQYRSYNIKSTIGKHGGDDYQMLREMLTRRLNKLDDNNKPDLLIIDGGKGHMSTALEVIEKIAPDIKFVCMAKGVDRNAGKEFFHMPNKEPYTLDKNTKLMKYLQILRDEAHNFAITTHRKKRIKSISFSSLDAMPNIGQMRKTLLLKHFGSLDAIKQATLEQISNISGIGTKIAKQIYDSLR